ncbi:MAG TPA: cytochrome c oxidase accessory protein CcoG, partial [Pseudomonas sp.]|nr:cytochrome c oxidase accessory protein CcoG [Pseudomonas sp.]
ACIDACDTIMDKMNYPRGLISYTTEHNLSGQKTQLARPRLIGYAAVLLIMMSVFTYAVIERPLVKLDVLKDRVLYRENEQGMIENVYTLKLMNKAQTPQTLIIEASGLDGLVYSGRSEIQANAGELITVPVELSIAPEKLPSSTNDIVFHVRSADDETIHDDADSRFIGPSIR